MALHGYYRKSIAPDGTQADKPDMDICITPRMAIISGCLMHPKHLARTQVNLKTSKRQIQKNPSLNIISTSLRSISSRKLKLNCHFRLLTMGISL